MTLLIAAGVGLAFGGVCRLLALPVPAPPALAGVVAVAAVSAGYWLTGVLR